MTLSEIKDLRAEAFQRLKNATAQSMSHKGRSAANYDLKSLREDLAFWDKQLQIASGKPQYGLAKL
jgi:hypothetical protein